MEHLVIPKLEDLWVDKQGRMRVRARIKYSFKELPLCVVYVKWVNGSYYPMWAHALGSVPSKRLDKAMLLRTCTQIAMLPYGAHFRFRSTHVKR